MDADAIVLASDAREKRDNFVTRVGSKCGERQIAVFTATPAEYDRFSGVQALLEGSMKGEYGKPVSRTRA